LAGIPTAAESALENGPILGTRTLAHIAINLSFKLAREFERVRFLRPKSTAHFLFFSTKNLAHAFNEYMLIESARILLTRFFISFRFF
jgi:hypothetical protein